MKRNHERKLGTPDLRVFEFLWKWKLATPLFLYEVTSQSEMGFLRFWKRLRRLYREGFLETESGLKDENLTLYRLSKKGFDQLMKSQDFIPEKRYKPQAVYHDYLATCFHHLPSFCGDFQNILHWSEYEASVFGVEHYPEWVPGRKEHIPDGYSLLINGSEKSLIAYEVEISQKPFCRYAKMLSFFGGSKSEYDFVFWLVGSERLAGKILGSRQSTDPMDLGKHQFFLLDDFVKNGWNTKCFLGATLGKSLKEIYSILLGTSDGSPEGHLRVTAGSLPLETIFFSSVISPRGFKHLKLQERGC